jgi:outer membrane immunogenic protein
MGTWVVGIRNMFDRTSVSGSRSFFDPTLFSGAGTVDTKVRWFDALTARGGYLVQPDLLFYVQGGAAWTQAEATAFNSVGAQIGSVSGNSRTGWTAGGGVEWMFVPHWCSLNTTTWALAHTARALRPAVPRRAASSAPKQMSRMFWWA